MKKFFSIVLILCIIVGLLCFTASCDNKNDDGRIKIVCTVFPLYDWVREILGDERENVDLVYLLDSGMDLHSYDPLTADIVDISTCDMFICVGGESEEWTEEILPAHPKEGRVEINLMDVLADKKLTEEASASMEKEEEEEGEGYDEHIWLSVRNAAVCVEKIAEKMELLDSEHAEKYAENAKTYCEKLASLDEDFTQFLSGKTTKMLLFADRFPFRYLVSDYKLSYDAAFAGCSSSSDITPQTMSKLATAINDNNLQYIFILEGSKEDNAKNIIARTEKKDQQILVLNSLQTVTDKQKNDTSYYAVMKNNFETLKKALV